MGSKTTLIVWVGISLGAVIACSVSACGLPSDCPDGGCPPAQGGSSSSAGGGGQPELDIDGVYQEGAIVCAYCARSPFCYDFTGESPVYVYRSDPDDSCGDLAYSQAATRRTFVEPAGAVGEETFHCAPPNSIDMSVPDLSCPGPPIEYAFVDECGADDDDTCVLDACTGNGEAPPTCESRHAETLSLCGKDEESVGTESEFSESLAEARGKIIHRVEGVGPSGDPTWNAHPNVPGNLNAVPGNPAETGEGPPDRYCFVSCFNQYYVTNPTSCDPADDPWVSATSTLVSVDPDSEAAITVNTTDPHGNVQSITSSVGIEGIMAIDVPRECRGLGGGQTATCNVGIGSVLLKGRSDVVVQGFTVSDLSVINRVNWTASASAYGGYTLVTLDAAPALVTATVDPFGRFGMRQELGGLSGEIDWAGRTYHSTATFRSPLLNGDETVLTLSGTIANIPPRADAGSDRSFECTGDGRANVTLTARGTDADGDEDVAAFVWSREFDGAWVVSSGPTLSTRFRVGESNVILTAIDSARAKDMDGAKITVVDSLAPGFSGIAVAPGSLWPANGRLHLFRLGQEIQPTVADVCDSSPAVRIAEVSGDGDFDYGDEAICIRAAAGGSSNELRRFTVTVEAVDASGNATTQDVVITNADGAPAVEDNDPRCP